MNTGDNKHLQEEVRLRLKLSSRMSSRCVKESDSNVCKIFLGPSWANLDHGHCARAGFPPLKIFKIWVTG